jgi:predicted Zn-dependent protease
MLADPADPWVRWVRARHFITTGRGRDGLDEFDAAATLDPSDTNLLAHRALAALYAGRNDVALERAAALARDEPEMPAVQMARAVILAMAGSADDARRVASRLLERPRAHPQLRPIAGIALATAGDVDGARAQLALAGDEYARGHHFAPTFVALLAAEIGDRSAAYRWLETALDRDCPLLAFTGVQPPFRRLRGDPEYRAVLRRIGREFLLDPSSTENPR